MGEPAGIQSGSRGGRAKPAVSHVPAASPAATPTNLRHGAPLLPRTALCQPAPQDQSAVARRTAASDKDGAARLAAKTRREAIGQGNASGCQERASAPFAFAAKTAQTENRPPRSALPCRVLWAGARAGYSQAGETTACRRARAGKDPRHRFGDGTFDAGRSASPAGDCGLSPAATRTESGGTGQRVAAVCGDGEALAANKHEFSRMLFL